MKTKEEMVTEADDWCNEDRSKRMVLCVMAEEDGMDLDTSTVVNAHSAKELSRVLCRLMLDDERVEKIIMWSAMAFAKIKEEEDK